MSFNTKNKWLRIIIIAVLLAPSIATYFYFFHPRPVSVTISGVDHEVVFSGVAPSGATGDFFSSPSLTSSFSVAPGGIFNDTISFHSIPSFSKFDVISISVSSPTSSSFAIVAMNATLPLVISPNETNAAILLTIKVPDSEFNGQVTVEITIGN